MSVRFFCVLLLSYITFSTSAFADITSDLDKVRPIDENMVIWGRGLDLTETALSASQGLVGYADFETRPLLRPGELVEVIPGLVATQHSGTGKANQYFLRGFNLDHGTDFAGFFEGLPINFRTHGHGQGYLDLNFIIPELIEVVEFRKGPYYADVGDFSAAGSISFKTYDALEEGFIKATAGEFDFYRLVAANSTPLAGGTLLYGGEVKFYDGPWDLEEDFEQYNGLVKFTSAPGDATFQLIATGFRADWTSTDQVPLRAVESGLIGRFGFIDPDLGGETTRINVIGRFFADALGGHLHATVYGSYYDFTLFSNFTYFAGDPVNGDEFEQEDRRLVFGGDAFAEWELPAFGFDHTLVAGVEARFDDILDVGLFNTVGRERIGTVRSDSVEQLSVSLYGDVTTRWTSRLETTIGMRIDTFDFDVDARITENSGDGTETLISPKVTAAYTLADRTRLYLNYGRGFHSNDVRGAAISVDPVTGDPVDPVDVLVPANGAEIGLRTNAVPSLTITLAAFWLGLESELVFVGDAGTTEVNDGSRRYGVEFSGFWEATDWLVFDASATTTNARFRNGDRIPGAVPTVAALGGTVLLDNGFTATARMRHFSSAPLIEDNSTRSEATTLVNAGIGYRFGPVEARLDVFNLFDAEDADITYFFESQLPGEPAPVEDIHFHPVEPRAVRGSLTVRF